MSDLSGKDKVVAQKGRRAMQVKIATVNAFPDAASTAAWAEKAIATAQRHLDSGLDESDTLSSGSDRETSKRKTKGKNSRLHCFESLYG